MRAKRAVEKVKIINIKFIDNLKRGLFKNDSG